MKQKNRSHIAFICRLRKSFLQFKQQVLKLVSKRVSKQISKQILIRLKLSELLFQVYDKLLQLCLVSYRRTAPPVIFFLVDYTYEIPVAFFDHLHPHKLGC